MRREIKFRAWHIPTQQMLPYAQIGVVRTFTENGSYLSKECVFLQYTGLKDKNGKEIYEGDIVRHLPTSFNSSSGVGEIYYHKGHVRFALKWVGNLEHYLDSLNSYEIIGNVYENPDLLSTQPSQE